MGDPHLKRQEAVWLYHYHRGESSPVLFDKTAHYAMLMMCWADQMERSALQLHAFNLAPAFYEVLVSGPTGHCQSALQQAASQFLNYRHQSCPLTDAGDIQVGDWSIQQATWARHAREALEFRARDCTGPTVISSWHYPACSLLSPLQSSPAANQA